MAFGCGGGLSSYDHEWDSEGLGGGLKHLQVGSKIIV